MFFQGFWASPSGVDAEAAAADMVGYGARQVWLLASGVEPDVLKAWGRAARRTGLRLHAWVIVNHVHGPDQAWARQHPEWVAVRRDGKSTLDEPFAGSQVWWCPSAAERLPADLARWKDLLATLEPDGLHLDYIRLPDTFSFEVSPLRDRRELPEQSYCYCDRCRSLFRAQTGLDPRHVPLGEDTEDGRAWQSFRQRLVARQVEQVRAWLPATLPLSAAVFPTPAIARRDVLQDWPGFAHHLDHVCPMIYAKRYWGRPMDWAEDAVREAKRELPAACRCYAGLGTLYASLEPGDIRAGARAAQRGGAEGFLLFSYPPREGWQRDELRAVVAELG